MTEEDKCSTIVGLLESYPPAKNEINEKLRELYAHKISDVFSQYVERYNRCRMPKITNPFLICVPDEYVNSGTKMMLVGKQTNGWCDQGKTDPDYPDLYSKQIPFEALQALYNWYVNSHGNTRETPIWDFYERLSAYATAKGIGIIANNIAKVGYVRGNAGYDKKAVRFLIDLFKEELRICKPNIVYFVTSQSYDKLISATLGRFECEDVLGVGVDKVAKLNFHTKEYANIVMYRTYSPSYLNSNSDEKWCKRIYEEIFHL